MALILSALCLTSGPGIARSQHHHNWLQELHGEKVIVFLANEQIIPEANGRAIDGKLVDVIPGGIVLKLDNEIFISYSAISLIEKAR